MPSEAERQRQQRRKQRYHSDPEFRARMLASSTRARQKDPETYKVYDRLRKRAKARGEPEPSIAAVRELLSEQGKTPGP